jgi:prolyl-tRNA editing enzyme YbaK/EbsC (Cys-tRNA(Pro) deacylase)
MALPPLGRLTWEPALDRPDLLGEAVEVALKSWPHASEVVVCAIDPDLADTAAMTKAYDVPLSSSANCVVVVGRRGGDERIAACVVRADTRADVNNLVRRALDVRKASFLSMDRAVDETGMEYGGITPVGLPAGWRVLVDARVAEIELVLVGSGIRGSKMALPGRLFAELPGAEVLADLGLAIGDRP